MRHHCSRFIAKRAQAVLSYAKEGLALSALLVLFSAAIMEKGPTPQLPPAALATPVSIEQFDLRLVEALADEEPQAVATREPLEAPARFHASAIEPLFEPAAGRVKPVKRIEPVRNAAVPAPVAKPVERPARLRLSTRFQAIAQTESAFAVALKRAAAEGYRERFAQAGSVAVAGKATEPRAKAQKVESRPKLRSPAAQVTVAEQIRQNQAKMPSTLHLSDLLARSVELAATAQQAAAPQAGASSS